MAHGRANSTNGYTATRTAKAAPGITGKLLKEKQRLFARMPSTKDSGNINMHKTVKWSLYTFQITVMLLVLIILIGIAFT